MNISQTVHSAIFTLLRLLTVFNPGTARQLTGSNFMQTIINSVRRALQIENPRATSRIGDIPRLGSRIHLDSTRMRVTINPSEEFWIWLVQAGWRECAYPRDRRLYTDLPEKTMKKLAKVHGLEREALYSRILAYMNTPETRLKS